MDCCVFVKQLEMEWSSRNFLYQPHLVRSCQFRQPNRKKRLVSVAPFASTFNAGIAVGMPLCITRSACSPPEIVFYK